MDSDKRGLWRNIRMEHLVSPYRFTQFLSVGFFGALVDNAVLVVLVEVVALSPVTAAVGAKEASIVLMFVLNERWTFRERGSGRIRTKLWRLVKSNVIRSGGAIIGITVLVVLLRLFGVWYLLANVIGIGVGFLFNYTFESLVTWQVHRSN